MDVIDALRGFKPLLILEASEGDCRHARPECGLPEDSRSASRAEVEFNGLPAVAYSGEHGRGPDDLGHLRGKEDRDAESGAGAPLALLAVADGDLSGLPSRDDGERATGTHGFAFHHDLLQMFIVIESSQLQRPWKTPCYRMLVEDDCRGTEWHQYP